MSDPIEIVGYRHPSVTVENDVQPGGFSFGHKVVKLDGKVAVTVHYVYPWTDNHSVNALAQKIAAMFRGDEPSPAPVQPEPLSDAQLYATIQRARMRVKHESRDVYEMRLAREVLAVQAGGKAA